MEQIPTTAQFGYYKELVVDTENVVEPNDVLVAPQLAQHVDFFLELGDILGVVAEHDTLAGKLFALAIACGVAFGFPSARNTHLSITALANHQVSMQQIGGPA